MTVANQGKLLLDRIVECGQLCDGASATRRSVGSMRPDTMARRSIISERDGGDSNLARLAVAYCFAQPQCGFAICASIAWAA